MTESNKITRKEACEIAKRVMSDAEAERQTAVDREAEVSDLDTLTDLNEEIRLLKAENACLREIVNALKRALADTDRRRKDVKSYSKYLRSSINCFVRRL